MLGVDHDKNILLSTPFPTIPMLGTNCWCNVIVFYVGNKRCYIVSSRARIPPLHNYVSPSRHKIPTDTSVKTAEVSQHFLEKKKKVVQTAEYAIL